MRIQKISRIHNHRLFQNFAWPNSLPEFAKYNLIYGWNGSGKTTISSLFRNLQERKAIEEGTVEFLVGDGIVGGRDIPTAQLPTIRVFNRDFIGRNVFEVAKEQLPPIYVIGEESVGAQKKLEGLHAQLEQDRAQLAATETTILVAQRAFEDFCSDSARMIKSELAGEGSDYTTYNATRFRQTAEQLLSMSPAYVPPDSGVLNGFESTRREASRVSIPPIRLNLPDVANLALRVRDAIARSVVSKTLAELIADPVLSTWVEKGLTLHAPSGINGTCRFCGQALPDGRIDILEGHFNDQFRRMQRQLDELSAETKFLQERLKAVQLPVASQLYQDIGGTYEVTHLKIVSVLNAAVDYLSRLDSAIDLKRKSMFEQFRLDEILRGIAAPELSRLLDPLNEAIRRHNARTENFEQERQRARKELERFKVSSALPAYMNRKREYEEMADQANAATRAITRLQIEIADLTGSIRKHQRPAEELNAELATYLGRSDIRFRVQDSGYTLTRDGNPASNLSEGERTAIAFMYFLKTLSEAGVNLSATVVVIDDPVSSLDANSLYCAFGYMKERTVGAAQVIILTHNFTLLRMVRQWFCKGLPKQDKKKYQYYMLRNRDLGGRRTAELCSLDPLLREFESEYQYLFKCVYEAANESTPAEGLSRYYGMPNMARRLIETVLAFKHPGTKVRLEKVMEDAPFDPARKARMIRFLHVYSHFDQVAEAAHDLSVLSETQAVLQDVMEFIKAVDQQHFTGMVERLQQDASAPRAMAAGTGS